MKKPTRLPDTPGVYRFKNNLGKIIYIGKAKSLKNRVSSYFLKSLGPKTTQMMSEAESLSFIEVDSEVEALLLEAIEVKKHLPKYNAELRDDKSPLYIIITKEKYPRVLAIRQTQISEIKYKKIFGPYSQGSQAKSLLRKLRKVFPYSQHKLGKRACLDSQIGLCSPCPSAIKNEKDPIKAELMKKSYLRNIYNLTLTLQGKAKTLKRSLESEMKLLSSGEKFEEARLKERQLTALEYLTKPPTDTLEYVKNPNFLEDLREAELGHLTRILKRYIDIGKIKRIECFDVAHLSGTNPTASMVTFINGNPDKSYYRHFRIRSLKRADDFAAMKEVLERRQKYFLTWGKPDLLVVDGGRPQLSAAHTALGDSLPVIGLAKRFERIYVKTKDGSVITLLPQGPALHLLQRLRDEAHRFARRYHHKLVKKSLV